MSSIVKPTAVALLEAASPIIVPAHLPAVVRDNVPLQPPGEATAVSGGLDFAALTRQLLVAGSEDIHRELVSMAEKVIFGEVLKATGNNMTQAARHLGITRTTLRARLETLELSGGKSRAASERSVN